MPAGYSRTPLAKKLGLKPGDLVNLLDAPAGFRKLLAPVPVVWLSWPKKASQVTTDITEDVIRRSFWSVDRFRAWFRP